VFYSEFGMKRNLLMSTAIGRPGLLAQRGVLYGSFRLLTHILANTKWSLSLQFSLHIIICCYQCGLNLERKCRLQTVRKENCLYLQLCRGSEVTLSYKRGEQQILMKRSESVMGWFFVSGAPQLTRYETYCTRWRRVIRFNPWPIYPQGKEPPVPIG
jgi:hypothetical protein